MIKKTHTRNQKRMYRIHKMEEQIEKDKIIIAEQQIELDKYKEVLDKIKKYIEENKLPEIYYDLESLKPILKHYIDADKILELLEEIE